MRSGGFISGRRPNFEVLALPAPGVPRRLLRLIPTQANGEKYREFSTPIYRALPVTRVELKIVGQTQTAKVSDAETVMVFTVDMAACPADIEATLLDNDGKALCGAYYVSVRKQ